MASTNATPKLRLPKAKAQAKDSNRAPATEAHHQETSVSPDASRVAGGQRKPRIEILPNGTTAIFY